MELVYALLAAFALLFAIVRRIWLSPLSNLPGPLLTSLTPYHLTILSHLNKRTVTIYRWHQQYGPIIRVSPTEVSVLSPKSVKAVYSNPAYEKFSPLYSQFTHFNALNSFTSPTRHEHSWRRKGYSAVYSLSHVLASEKQYRRVHAVINEYLANVERQPTRSVDLYTLNSFFATDAITTHLFGSSGATKCLQGNKEHRSIVLSHYADEARAKTHLSTAFPKVMQAINAIVYRDAAKKYIGGSRIREWAWWAYQKKEEGTVAAKLARSDWDEAVVMSEIMDQLLAGMDTTADTLSFLIYKLSMHDAERVQRALRVSLLSLGITPESLVENLDAVMNDAYLDAVVHEAMRLYSAVPVSLPRVTPAAVTLDGYTVPAGTVVSTFAYGVHRWDTENAQEFAPERWLDQTAKPRFWAFGSGSRSCVGRHQAVLEMKMLLAGIYCSYATVVDHENLTPASKQWNQPKTFQDVLPFAGAKGIVKFVPLRTESGIVCP